MEDDSSSCVSEDVESEDMDTARECRVARRELCAAQPWNLGAVLQAAFDLINASLRRWSEQGCGDDESCELLKDLVQLLEATAAQPGDDVPDYLELLASLFLLGVSGGFFKRWCTPAHDSLSLVCAPGDGAAAVQAYERPGAVQLALLRLLAPPLVDALLLLEEVEAYQLFADAAEHVAGLCEGDDVLPPAMSIRVPPAVRVLALDLDDTVYMHDHIPEMFQVYEAVRGFMDPLVLRDMLAAGVPHRGFLLALIDSMHATGRNVFVVSFGRDDWVLPAAEAALGGRVPSTAIYTRSDEPHGEEPPDKSGWLADIARRCGVPRSAVQLVDDSTINVHAAVLDGFQALRVSPVEGLHYALWHEALRQYSALQLGLWQQPLSAQQPGPGSGAAGQVGGCAAQASCPPAPTATLRSGNGMGLAGCGMIRVPAPASGAAGSPAAATAAVAATAAGAAGAAASSGQARRESPRDAQDKQLPRSPSRVGSAGGSPHSITGSPLSRTGSGGSPLGESGGTPRMLLPSFAEAGEAAVLLTAAAHTAAKAAGAAAALAAPTPAGGRGAAGGGEEVDVDTQLAAAVEALVLSVVAEALEAPQQAPQQQAGAAAATAGAAAVASEAASAGDVAVGSSASEAAAVTGGVAQGSAVAGGTAAVPMAGGAGAALGRWAVVAAAGAATAAAGSDDGSALMAGHAGVGAGEVSAAGGAAAAADAAGEQDDSPAWGVVEEAAVLAALRGGGLSAPPSECSVGSASGGGAGGVHGGGSLSSTELGLPRRGSSGGSSSCGWGEDDGSVSLLVAEVGCGGGSERGSERGGGGTKGGDAAPPGKQGHDAYRASNACGGNDGAGTVAVPGPAAGAASPAGSGSPKRGGGFAGFVARHSPRRHRKEAGAPCTDGAAAPPAAAKPAAAATAASASAPSPAAAKAGTGVGAEQWKGNKKKKGLAGWLARRGAEQSPQKVPVAVSCTSAGTPSKP